MMELAVGLIALYIIRNGGFCHSVHFIGAACIAIVAGMVWYIAIPVIVTAMLFETMAKNTLKR